MLAHIYSGHLFFTAVLLFVAGVSIPRLRLFALLAVPLALFSGTPMPLIVAVPLLIAAIATLLWKNRWRPLVAVAISVVAVAIEIPWHRTAKVEPPRRLIVLGDSLSSGGFGETTTWVARLGAENFSSASETVATALRTELPPYKPGDMVIVELGGNDMLDGTPAREFAESLDVLLARLQPRRIIMLEIPILPGRWHYGASQRRLARKHHVVLLPKRLLAKVLTRDGNTTDGLHLTDRGHEQMAQGLADSLGW